MGNPVLAIIELSSCHLIAATVQSAWMNPSVIIVSELNYCEYGIDSVCCNVYSTLLFGL